MIMIFAARPSGAAIIEFDDAVGQNVVDDRERHMIPLWDRTGTAASVCRRAGAPGREIRGSGCDPAVNQLSALVRRDLVGGLRSRLTGDSKSTAVKGEHALNESVYFEHQCPRVLRRQIDYRWATLSELTPPDEISIR